MNDTDVDAAEHFIGRWKGSAASELSTSQSFLIGLCELLGVERPHATPEQDYMFERPLTFHHGDGSTSAGRGSVPARRLHPRIQETDDRRAWGDPKLRDSLFAGSFLQLWSYRC